MIEDLKAFLEADAPLAALLPGGGSNTKIYYLDKDETGGEETPYILLSYQTDGTSDDLIDEALFNLRVVAETYEVALAIVKRLTDLLDIQDDVQIPSSANKIFYAKKVGGGSDSKEQDTKLFVLARLFHVKFKRNGGG